MRLTAKVKLEENIISLIKCRFHIVIVIWECICYDLLARSGLALRKLLQCSLQEKLFYLKHMNRILQRADWRMNNDVNKHKKVQIIQQNLRKRRNIEGTSAVYLTGSLLKNTRDALVRINQRFFHDVHPIPVYRKCNMQCFISKVKCDQLWKVTKWGNQALMLKQIMTIWHQKRDSINKLFKVLKERKENTEFMQYHTYLQESIPLDESSKCPLLRTCTRRILIIVLESFLTKIWRK